MNHHFGEKKKLNEFILGFSVVQSYYRWDHRTITLEKKTNKEVAVNCERYGNMLEESLKQQLKYINDFIWNLPKCLVPWRSEVNWPAKLCDFTLCYFFLWGYLRSKVYANKPNSKAELINGIWCVIGQIQRSTNIFVNCKKNTLY